MRNSNFVPSTLLALALLTAFSPRCSEAHAQPATPGNPYTYVTHKVSTDNAAAQAAFERGLTLVFAYQRGEAEVSFREAARLDPSLAMAWWGIGLALGPDINSPPEAKSTLQAAQALKRAQKLAAIHATPVEREYIDALATRYSTSGSPDFDALAKTYRDAMEMLARKYPSDADAQALFAEALMDQHPWRLWTWDGRPAPDTELLVRTIENGLKQHPDHIGLLHFYIHAVEASQTPERALAAAHRLGAMPMEPAAAHLVHMPAHIFLRVGDWPSAIDGNERGRQMALSFQLSKDPTIELSCGHCLDFLTYAYATQGDAPHAMESAITYTKVIGDPSNELSVLLRFGRWDDVLTHEQPPANPPPDSRNADVMRAYWHYARGLAFSATGRAERAAEELDALRKSGTAAPQEPEWDASHFDLMHVYDKMSAASDAVVLKIAERVLAADLQEKAGHLDAAVAMLKEAVALQDRIQYGEPPAWFYPMREKLGAVMLRAGRSAEAETVLREALRHAPNHPRVLFALSEALAAQGKATEAARLREAFKKAWSPAGGSLTVAAL